PDIKNTHTSGPKPRLEILLAGWNDGIHRIEVLVGSNGSLRSLTQQTFKYFDTHLISEELEWSDLMAGNFTIRVAVNNDTSDFISVSYIKLNYPQSFEMNGGSAKTFQASDVGVSTTIEIQNAPASSIIYQVQDPNNVSILNYDQLTDRITTVIPSSTLPPKLKVTAEPALAIGSLKKVDFAPISSSDYLIISHGSLRKPAGSYGDPVQAYADYRGSEQGGGFNTILVEASDLYDRFNYGEVSPIAIRRFAQKMLDLGDPKYLLLLGKAYNVRFNPYRRAVSPDLVPTLGFPGSDIALTAGLDGTVYESAIATGRINARSPEQVAAYLDKVKESEAQTGNALWSKNLIHLSGGITNSEQTRFKNYVDDFKDLAEGPYLGGQVTTINKQSNETVELINIADEVNKGVGLITFFGHSSPDVTDIEIGDASDPTLGYENQGRYPMILVSGCNAGNIFGDAVGFGEDWIVTPDKGALGFAAHTAFGFENNLKRYADVFYQTAHADSNFIQQPIGDILIEVSKKYLQNTNINERQITQTQQVVFQGDPAVRFFGTNLPDYETTDESLFLESFDSQDVNALADSFRLGVITRNLGIAESKPLNLGVRRTFSDGQTIIYDSVFYPPVSYQDTLYFTVRSNEISNFGENQFEVILDFNESIEESDEENNKGLLSVFIPLGGTLNLNPQPFAIVGQQPVRLLSQSSDLLSGERVFQFEIDTSETFESPWKQDQMVTADGLAEWEVTLLEDIVPNDSVVYYWRTRFQTPRIGEDSSWTRSSFIYIKDSPRGWSQAAFPQFEFDPTLRITRNVNSETWEFATTDTRINVVTYGKDHPDNEPANIKVNIAGQAFIVGNRGLCATNSMNAVAFDRSSTIPYPVVVKPGFDVLDPNRCGRSPQVINRYNNSEISDQNKLDQYLDLVPPGDHVLLFSIGNVLYENWSNGLADAFQTIGVAPGDLQQLRNGQPLIILGRKGAPIGSAVFLTESLDQGITLDQEIKGAFDQGSITSPAIGPALSWGTLHKNLVSSEQPGTDQVQIEIIGIDRFGNEQVLFEQIDPKIFDLSVIDANQYPKIKLRAHLMDTENLTPAQLKKWQVMYEPAPEGVILFRGSEYGLDQQLVLEEGAAIDARFTFVNISDQLFSDSVTVQYRWFNRDSRVANESTLKVKPLAPFDSAQFSVSVTTFGNYGSNDLKVFANPRLIPERVFNNNIIDLPKYLQINQDLTNPILNVTFDGRQISNGEIVSPNPLIEVLLKEDNPFVFKEDTIGMTLAIKYPNCENCNFEPIYFSDSK
ncbi:MAG: C25 family cysteine peptidase, partial [Cyclobacteriaceae bacterium]